MQKESDTQIK